MGKYIGNIVTDGGPTGYSCSFNGSSQSLLVANNAALSLSTGDFTIEAWIYLSSTSKYSVVSSATTSARGYALEVSTTVLGFNVNNGGSNTGTVSYSGTITSGVWHHIAACRSGTTTRLFVDGAQVASGTLADQDASTTNPVYVGAQNYTGFPQYFNGYLSNVRIVKGTALYTAAFTPPTQLANITNTSLLACQQPTIIDASSNNFTITNNGTTTVSTLTPFTAYASYTPAAGGASPGIWKQSDLTRFTQNRQINMYDPSAPYNTLLLNGNGTNGAQNNTFLVTPPGGVGQYTGSFNGTSQYLTVPNNAAWAYGTGDFTVEAWLYKSAAGSMAVIDMAGGPSLGTFGFAVNDTQIIGYQSQGAAFTFTYTLTRNAWRHVAFTRSGTTLTCYVNGTSIGTLSCTSNFASVSALAIGYNPGGLNSYWNGYISNVRLVKGTAVYTGNFSVPTTPLTAVSGTQLLTCQSATFVDNSPNNFTITNGGSTTIVNPNTFPTITRNGTPTQGSFSPYGSQWGVYFPNPQKTGTNQTYTDFLTVNSANVNLSGSSYTMEAWIYPTVLPTNTNPTEEMPVFGWYSAYNNRWGLCLLASGGGLVGYIFTDGPNTGTQGTTSYPINQWMHIAATYDGTTTRVFINGVLNCSAVASYARSINLLYIGKFVYGSGSITDLSGFQGWISNARILKGTALYTANFTPPTAPLTAITNTVLLTCQSNTFKDNSSGALTVSANGNSAVQRFSPFPNNAPYEAAYYGGGGYFNGTTDWLSPSTGAMFAIGTNSFTLEAWVYPTQSASTESPIIKVYTLGGSSLELRQSTNKMIYILGFNGDTAITGTQTLNINAWNHVAFTRNGTTTYAFLNGVADGSNTGQSQNLSTANPGVYIARNQDNAHYFAGGYITDLRFINGTALYTAAFTPPSTPLTAVANTGLLLSMSNAAIADGAAGNELITVGTAQVSTGTVKYGTGSMVFANASGGSNYITAPTNALYQLGTGNFTVEFWMNSVDTTSRYVFMLGTDWATANTLCLLQYLGQFALSCGTVNVISLGTQATNTWMHIAIVRSGSTVTLYLNGTSIGSITSSENLNIGQLRLGQQGAAAYWSGYYGFIDDLRITKGVARYTANFTPPTSQLQNC